MKWILGLLIGTLIASPVVAQVTRAEVEQIAAASDARILAKLEKISEKLATVETDIAVMKTDIAALKTGLRETKAELKEYVDSKFDALNREQAERDKRVETEIRGLTRQLSFVQFLLGILVTGLLTVLLALLKSQWDKRKADREKLGTQQKALAEKQSEIDALRAENERIKNTSGLVSPTGGRLENEVERERA